MSKIGHNIYIATLVAITFFVFFYLLFKGLSYYQVNIEERFFHPDYQSLKPSGIFGHGIGIIGTLLIIIGVAIYMIRKRVKYFAHFGYLKHWLEFHIFLCTVGPIMVLFHTSFKFGGVVSISFWSMVAVFLSGIVGRFIYIQIPRTIEGRELSLTEVKNLKTDVGGILNTTANLDESSYREIIELTKKKIEVLQGNFITNYFKNYFDDKKSIRRAETLLKNSNIDKSGYKKIMQILQSEISLNRKIDRLTTMKNMLKYWHVIHLPFAVIMFIIMIVHVIVTILFGYRWVF